MNLPELYRERLELLLSLRKVSQNADTALANREAKAEQDDVEVFREKLRTRIAQTSPEAILSNAEVDNKTNKLAKTLRDARLNNLELDAYMLCLCLEESPGFYSLGYKVFGESYPQLNQRRFLEDVLCEYHGKSAQLCFDGNSSLIRKGFIRYAETNKFLPSRDRLVLLNDVWVNFILGKEPAVPGIQFHPAEKEFRKPYQPDNIVDTLTHTLTSTSETASRPVFHFHGPKGSGKRRLARFLCSSAGLARIEIELATTLKALNAVSRLRSIIRVASTCGHAIIIDMGDLPLNDAQKEILDLFNFELSVENPFSFITTTNKLNLSTSINSLTTLELRIPTRMIRERTWTEILPDYNVAKEVSASEFARTFHIGGESVRSALQEAAGLAGVNAEIQRADLLRICRNRSTSRLSELAFLVEPKFGWDDLILPPHAAHLVREIEADIRADEHIFEQWRMDRIATAAKGHNILFTGIPGTGKTMAASIIAAELGLELYKVDLSRVSSKYVGEVEKNLSSLFDEAEKANAALFFDEADSLFGKRGKNDSAQGHYINQQIGYLLQRMESYKGIAFMATNLHENIDEAFERRFTHVVRFNYPSEQERLRIWERSFTPETPLADDVDFPLLAHEFECTGAHIKSIALRAARRAVADDSRAQKVVTRFDIIYGTVREFDKIKPGWSQGYKDVFQEDIARVRTLLTPDESSTNLSSHGKELRPEDLDWGTSFN